MIFASERRNTKLRSSARPRWTCGVPSAFWVALCAPSQVVWRPPDAKLQVPVSRQPPGTLIALLRLWRAPQARPTLGLPKTSSAVSGGIAAAEVAEETFDWVMNEVALASAYPKA